MMKRFVFLGFTLFLGFPIFASADEGASSQMMQASTPETKQAAKEYTPEEKAYKAKMIKKSDEIAAKIKQIQAMDKTIEEETYLASKPPLIAQKVILEEELRKLQMDRDKLQAEESARKMTQDLKNNTSHSP